MGIRITATTTMTTADLLPEARSAMFETRAAIKAELIKIVTDECPVWEQHFDAGPGIVCSVDDAATVVSHWLVIRERAAAADSVDPLRVRVATAQTALHQALERYGVEKAHDDALIDRYRTERDQLRAQLPNS